jgi:hypothetical protein
MKRFLLAVLITAAMGVNAQTLQNVQKTLDKQDRWTARDLMQPDELARILNDKKSKQPVILNIGVVENIAGARKTGAASKAENLAALGETLKKLPKNSSVIIYCGCCPFDKCPNIRPAFNLMKGMGFVNGRLLNIPVNLQQNWINKGYPMLVDGAPGKG